MKFLMDLDSKLLLAESLATIWFKLIWLGSYINFALQIFKENNFALLCMIASSFYCIIATMSLLVPSRMVEARIGMLMTTLLTLTAMFAAIR